MKNDQASALEIFAAAPAKTMRSKSGKARDARQAREFNDALKQTRTSLRAETATRSLASVMAKLSLKAEVAMALKDGAHAAHDVTKADFHVDEQEVDGAPDEAVEEIHAEIPEGASKIEPEETLISASPKPEGATRKEDALPPAVQIQVSALLPVDAATAAPVDAATAAPVDAATAAPVDAATAAPVVTAALTAAVRPQRMDASSARIDGPTAAPIFERRAEKSQSGPEVSQAQASRAKMADDSQAQPVAGNEPQPAQSMAPKPTDLLPERTQATSKPQVAPQAAERTVATVSVTRVETAFMPPTLPMVQNGMPSDAAKPAEMASPVPVTSQIPSGATVVKSIRLQLQPEHLGEVQISLHLKGEGLRVTVEVATREAHAMLQRDATMLRDVLEKAGYDLAEQAVTVTLRMDAPQAQPAATGGNGDTSSFQQGPHGQASQNADERQHSRQQGRLQQSKEEIHDAHRQAQSADRPANIDTGDIYL